MKYVDQVIYGFLFGAGFIAVSALAKFIFHTGIC